MPIFDQGYQHWSGQLAGHAWRWLAITRHGLRIALAGTYVKLLLFVASLPALLLVFVLCMWGLLERNSSLIMPLMQYMRFLDAEILSGPRDYRVVIWTLSYGYFMATQLWIAMVMILLVGPNLISQDLRYNALPLYFSRPLRRIDYFAGKLGVIVALLGMVMILPAIAAYVLGLAFSLDVTIIRDTFGILLACVVYGLVISVSAGLLILAFSSLSRNSRYVALFWVGMWIVSNALSGILTVAHEGHRRHQVRRVAASGSQAEMQVDDRTAAERDWRPLISYTANLSRVGQHLLGTDAAWEVLSKLRPPGRREGFLLERQGPQYPWYWSAGVLVGLMGLSVCILNLTIRSLDRLK